MRISILQWNVWFKEDIERILSVLKEYPADVICLQELTRGYAQQSRENTWDYITQELGYAYRVQEVPIITGEGRWTQGNMICSRLPLTGSRSTWLHEPSNPESSDDQYRGYLEITLNASGEEVTVATTHLSFKADMSDDTELQRLLDIIGKKRERFVLTGDFNATPDSPRIMGLEKALRHAGPPYTENTWTTKPYIFDGVEKSTLDWRLDYIFTTRDCNAAEAVLIPTTVSDHLPIRAVIEVPD